MVKSFYQGDTIRWTVDGSKHSPADGWSLVCNFICSPFKTYADATVEDNNFIIYITSDDTMAWPPGKYTWQTRVTKGKESYTVNAGFFTVKPSIASDAQNHSSFISKYQRIIDSIDEYFANPDSIKARHLVINDKELVRYQPRELLLLKTHYEQLLFKEKQALYAAEGKESPTRRWVRVVSVY